VIYRSYDPTKDKDAVRRIWREAGWLPAGKEDVMDRLLECGQALVAEMNGEPECAVTSTLGSMRYLDQDLPLAEYTSVATSRIGRRQGLAKRVLARTVAADRADGALLGRVCVFDQGFYNQVGFGAGGYEHSVEFDPAALKVTMKARVPRRLTKDDAALIHASRLARRRGHGSTNYPLVAITEIETHWGDNKFGLGYCDESSGELTHHMWCNTRHPEHGPYSIAWMTYRSDDQFLELMALLKNLSDQVALIEMREPQGIQLQDLLDRPFRRHRVTERSRFENRIFAYAFWQVRMLDLRECLARTRLRCGQTRFNLRLTDPIERLLDDDASWRGVAGDYVVTLGPSSGADTGHDSGLPTLSASVNAFTRMWLGVRPATGLAVTDELTGPAPLLEELDWTLRLPEPKPDWDF